MRSILTFDNKGYIKAHSNGRNGHTVKTSIMELLQNADDANSNKIMIKYRKKANMLIIADNGIGMPINKLENMSVLYRHEEVERTKHGKFGIGAKEAFLTLGGKWRVLTKQGGSQDISKLEWDSDKLVKWSNNEIEVDKYVSISDNASEVLRRYYLKTIKKLCEGMKTRDISGTVVIGELGAMLDNEKDELIEDLRDVIRDITLKHQKFDTTILYDIDLFDKDKTGMKELVPLDWLNYDNVEDKNKISFDFDGLNQLKENGLKIIHTIDGFVGIKNKVEEYAMKKVQCMNKQSIQSILQEPAIHRRISLCSDRVPKFFKMIEIDEENKTASWAVEKMKGSLKDLIPEDGVKDYDDVRDCILGCLRSVSDVHRFGEVAHMDIKPDNFMANSFVDIKLSDFGSTTTKPFIDGTRMIVPEMFTLYTTSPECVKATCLDGNIEIDGEKSDAWSIGCSIIYVLTGKPIYPGCNCSIIMMTLMDDKKPKIPEGLPKDINEFLEDCLKLIDEGRKTPTELLEKYEAIFLNENSISE